MSRASRSLLGVLLGGAIGTLAWLVIDSATGRPVDAPLSTFAGMVAGVLLLCVLRWFERRRQDR